MQISATTGWLDYASPLNTSVNDFDFVSNVRRTEVLLLSRFVPWLQSGDDFYAAWSTPDASLLRLTLMCIEGVNRLAATGYAGVIPTLTAYLEADLSRQ